MTLPFRRRHNDAEASHDRARSLIATGFLEPVGAADQAWLEAHLAGCSLCARDAEAYAADRELLRSLRDRAPEPPRDLWARTAAEIERSQGRRERGARTGRSGRPARIGRVPIGVMSGVLVVLVVIGASLAPHGGVPLPGRTDSARGSAGVEATPISVDADALAWIQLSPDGSYELYQASVDEVCADPRDGCALLNTRNATRLQLKEAPQSVLFSQDRSQIVVVTKQSPNSGADIVVVSVPTSTPTATLTPPPSTTSPETTGPSASTDAVGSPSATPVIEPTSSPIDTASGSPFPTGSVPPSAGHAIVSGVVVVGDAAYSEDGAWLAFSARPADQTTGPDLYTWHVGDEKANAVTADHRTFFAGWLGNRIIANRVGPALVPESPDPAASGDPSAAPATSTPPPSTGPADASASPAASPILEDHPVAFIFDPTTSAVTPLGGSDVWHPTVDPTGSSVVYWAGTLVPDGTGTGWKLGTGHLVLDGWLDGEPSPSDDGSPAPGDGSPSPAVEESAVPTAPAIGPAGHPITLSEDAVAEFDAFFDRTGTRLAVWVGSPTDATVGTLRLVVLDPETGQVDASADPLPGVAALRGISIRPGRLAWVTPPGQDGQGSHVQVLAWRGRDFGQVRTVQGDGFFVAR